MASEVDPLIRTGISRIQKVEWLTAFTAAHDKSLTPRNIFGGFRGSSIHPFWSSKVLDRVAPTPLPYVQNRAARPQIPTTPFTDAVLTSSPIHFNAIHQATIALDTELDSGNSLSTPARKFVKCLHASNSILQYENDKQKAVLGNTKRHLSGKMKVIDGKHVMTGVELVGVQEAERVTDQRKGKKKGTASPQRRSKVRKESNDMSEEESNITEDEEIEILDCIEVEI